MKSLILLAVAAALITPGTPVRAATAGAGSVYHFDTTRYLFRAPAIHQGRRIGLPAAVGRSPEQPVSSLDTPAALSRWHAVHDSLSKRLNRHQLSVYLRGEEDTKDHADAAADDVLEAAIAKLE